MIFPLLLTKGYSQNDIKIIYNLKLGLINGGTATMIKKDTLYNNKKCIYYLLEGNTNGLTDKIFPYMKNMRVLLMLLLICLM